MSVSSGRNADCRGRIDRTMLQACHDEPPIPPLSWRPGSTELAPIARGSNHDPPRMTPDLPKVSEATGAVIICPGGGYVVRADHEGEPVARWLTGFALAAFVLEYRVAPARHPVPPRDAQGAIRLVHHRAREWNVDLARISILGFSGWTPSDDRRNQPGQWRPPGYRPDPAGKQSSRRAGSLRSGGFSGGPRPRRFDA